MARSFIFFAEYVEMIQGGLLTVRNWRHDAHTSGLIFVAGCDQY